MKKIFKLALRCSRSERPGFASQKHIKVKGAAPLRVPVISMNRRSYEERKSRFALTFLVTCIVLAVLVVIGGIIVGLIMLLISLGFVSDSNGLTPAGSIAILVIISVIIGAALSYLFSRITMKPINKIINSFNQLAAGNFNTRLEFNGVWAKHATVREISDSFNTMAEELENTEMLRSDFINNFSHEFKTPIVSISGFAKLLKHGDLTEEQKAEYIGIIAEESSRLASMATNVLNLTKVENQTILTGQTTFNLSEQIRGCILLLESKWSAKNIEFHIDFDEYDVYANEEMLKQVWINLIDNAVKFSPDYGIVSVGISENNGLITVSVTNSGTDIPAESIDRIFNKFYQADESHSSEGNGIGLAIVKQVVKLHGGTVAADSRKGRTTFTVMLPAKKEG